MRDIGKNIKDLRQQKGMTQEELAARLFVTRQTISNYEQGKTRPDIEMLIKISSILAVDVNVILYGIPSFEDRVRKIKRISVTFFFFLTSAIIYNTLFDWALQIKRNEYNSYPIFWIMILYRPFVAFLLGHTIIQILGVFIKFPNIFQTMGKRKIMISIVFIILYITIMLPFLLLNKWPWTPPTAWKQVVYYLLDLLPSRTSTFSNVFWGFLLGFFLYKPSIDVPNSIASSTD